MRTINSFNLMFGCCLILIGILLLLITNYDMIFIRTMQYNRLLYRYSYIEVLLHNKYGLNNFDYLKGAWLDFLVCGIFLIVIPLFRDIEFKRYYSFKMLKKKIKKEKKELINYFYN